VVDLTGKVVLITGAARGQGAEEARLFSTLGATVMVTDIVDDAGRAVADDLGKKSAYRHLDVSEPEQWDEALADVLGRWGRVDVLVNNAGIWATSPIEDQSVEEFDRIVAVNLRGTFLGIRSVAAPMRGSGGGSIVNIASVAGIRGLSGHGAYGSSKWAIRGLTQVAAAELGPSGIRVNAILPGVIDTPMIGLSDEARNSFGYLPLGRVGRPVDVATLAAYLASDGAAYVTGAEMVVDGGLVVSVHHP